LSLGLSAEDVMNMTKLLKNNTNLLLKAAKAEFPHEDIMQKK
jgi:hypothetical protein